MNSDALLDSLVFRLTPTRTRCDLVITSNGTTEKVGFVLLDPFLAHLKTAKEQIDKGGYSIVLQPPHGSNAPWFTKDTVERFVRFVNTPEVLERVNTIETEILQIEEAIAQGNECIGSGNVENDQKRPMECIEGSNIIGEGDAEKAIVLYKPGEQQAKSNGPMLKEENSKVQLLRVLETRKTVLQKEQGMAFARAAAAGFDMDQMTYLISFAECFGASRLLVACIKFMELWKVKHETGQWIEIEAAEAMNMQSDFSSMNASGIFLSGDTRGQKDNFDTAEYLNSDDNKGRTSGDRPVPLGSQENFQSQFQHHMFPQWPMHSPPGAPGFHPFPMQGMPYNQNYPSNGPFFQPPYSITNDSKYNSQRKAKTKWHHLDGKDSNYESDSKQSPEETDPETSNLDKDISAGRESRRSGQSGKDQPGVVVIRNINYISKRQNESGSESESASASETDEESDNLHDNKALQRRHKRSSLSLKIKGKKKTTESMNLYEEDTNHRQEAGSENWQAFQSFLLRDDKSRNVASDDMFSSEKLPPTSRRQNNVIADPMLPPDRSDAFVKQKPMEFDTVNGRMTARKKSMGSDGDFTYSNDGRTMRDYKLDVKFQEMEGSGAYRQSDNFMIYEQGKQKASRNSIDPLSDNVFKLGGDFSEESQAHLTDETFIVPRRSSQLQVRAGKQAANGMDLDFPPALHRTEESSVRNRNAHYQPEDLRLLPDRRAEGELIGCDPAIDDVMKAHIHYNANGSKEDISASTKRVLKKTDEKKSKPSHDALEKRKMDLLRRGKPLRNNSLAEAQARAEKLRAYKADLLKEKKEKEEQERKRLESLKIQRQKRIAARGTSTTVQKQTILQNHARVPAGLSASSRGSSKFSDSGLKSSPPLFKLPKKDIESTGSQKTSEKTRFTNHSDGKKLTRSLSSLSEKMRKNDVVVPEQKKDGRSKRLSDPRGGTTSRASSVMSASDNQASRRINSRHKVNNVPHSLVKAENSGFKVRNVPDETKIGKTSVIVSSNKPKPSTRQGLNTRKIVGFPNAQESRPNIKEATRKTNINKSRLTRQLGNGEDNLIVEKGTVIQEKETVDLPIVAAREGRNRETTDTIPEYAATETFPSTIIFSEANEIANKNLQDEKPTCKVIVDRVKDEAENIYTPTENSSQAPMARVSSMGHEYLSPTEYSSTIPSNQSEALPGSLIAENVQQNEILEKTFPDAITMDPKYDKPRVKDSSKGFKKLLKFGRKSHPSNNESNVVSRRSPDDGNITNAVSPSEAVTLKSLISEDDPHAESISKASRSFSILSPFRNKANDKRS